MKNFIPQINRAIAAKKQKFFMLFIAALISVSVFAARDIVPSDVVLADYYEQGNVCVCFFVPADMNCNGIVLTGTFNGWSSNVASCVAVEAVEGYDGWYVASIEPEAEPDAEKGMQIKPIMLDAFGAFNWTYQIGAATKIRGGVEVVQGLYAGEIDLIHYGTDAPNVFSVDAWKQNPCAYIYNNYTIKLYAPDACEGMKPAITGDFNGWKNGVAMTEKLDGNFETYYEYSFKDREGHSVYIKELADTDWSNALQYYDEENDEWRNFNYELGSDTLMIFDVRDNYLYRYAKCKESCYLTFQTDPMQGYISGYSSCPRRVNVTLTAIPYSGYHFAQWSDGATENPHTIFVTQDTTITAEFAKNTYSITTESSNNDWGTTAGDTSALYLEQVEISAIVLKYGYHFVQWNDGNTSNPRTITITEDKTYTATFAKSTYSITKIANSEQGSISGSSQGEYLDEVTLTANPKYGYHFKKWSDGETENPRSFILTRDTTFTAEFAVDRTGTCGTDLALTWTYEPEEKVLTISGEGAFNENMQCGAEARTALQKIVFANGVTSIGTNAFANCATLKTLILSKDVKKINENAFYNCDNLTAIYNYRPTPTNIYSNTFSGVDKFECILYVPDGSVAMYKSDGSNWKDFYFIESMEAAGDEYTVTYIDKDEVIIDSESIKLHLPEAPEIEGFTFLKWMFVAGDVMNGLTIQAIYEANEPTSAPATYTNPANPAQKLIRNGNVYILTEDKVYTITGQEVR